MSRILIITQGSGESIKEYGLGGIKTTQVDVIGVNKLQSGLPMRGRKYDYVVFDLPNTESMSSDQIKPIINTLLVDHPTDFHKRIAHLQ